MNSAVKQYSDKLRSAISWRSNAREIMVSFAAAAWDEASAARKYNVLMARWAKPESLPGFGVTAKEANKVGAPVKQVPFIHAVASAPEPPKSAIQQHLESVKTMVETNPAIRLPRYINKFNKNLAALSVDITDEQGNQRTIEGKDCEASKLKVPSWIPKVAPSLVTHEAVANVGGKDVALQLEVIT